MAQKTITQRIAFEGGQEMEVQLKAIGDTGQVAFQRLQKAVNDANGYIARLPALITDVQARFKILNDSVDNANKKFGDLGSSLETVGRRLLIAEVAIAAVVAGFAALVIKSGQTADELARGAAAAGINVQEYQGLRDAFDVAGVGADTLDKLLQRMNNTFGKSATSQLTLQKSQRDLNDQFNSGKINAEQYNTEFVKLQRDSQQAINVFNRLGVSASTAFNDPKEALLQTLSQLNKLPDGIEKSSLELQIFGQTGVQIAPLVSQLEHLKDTVEKLAPPLTELEVGVGTKMAQSIRTAVVAADNLRLHIGAVFQPDVTAVVDAFTERLSASRDTILKFAETLQAAVKPVIDDIVKLLKGEDVDPNGFVGQVRTAFIQFAEDAKQAIGIIVAAWDAFVEAMDVVASAINAIFGTNFSGRALAMVAILGTVSGAFAAIGAAVSAIVAVLGVFDALVVAVFGPEAALLVGLALAGAAIGALVVEIAKTSGAWQALVDGFNGTVANFEKLFQVLATAWGALWDGAKSYAQGAFDSVLGWLDEILGKIAQAASAIKSLFSGSGSGSDNQTSGFASGGSVRGPGTARSDSILARLSNGEFVHQAPAVAYYGERFMHALNNMQIPRGILDGLAGFANGGLVRAASMLSPGLPAFANGGLVSADAIPPGGAGGGRPFILQIGGETFGGLTVEDRTFNRLQSFATKRHIASGGRKPQWVK